MNNHSAICVLGSGAVGQTVAYAGRKAGLSVTVIETQAPGGTCPNRGCDAKKPYVNAAGLMYRVGCLNAAAGGIDATAIQWSEIARFKKSFTDPVGVLTAADLRKAGIELIEGSPSFIDDSSIEVNSRIISADRYIIATGQRPRTLDVPGGELTINSDELLDLDDLPRRVTFIGGGYVGMEFACASAIAGHEVSVIATRDHTLAGFDSDIVAIMEQALPNLGPHGVRVIPNRRVGSVTKNTAGELTVHANDSDATALVTADLVVNASGRVASIDTLNLDACGVTHSHNGIVVDNHLRCPGNIRFWAGGDVADNGRPALIPTAVDDARILAHNLFTAGSDTELKHRSVAQQCSVAFTTPAVAGAGFTELEARSQYGDHIHVAGGSMSNKKFFRELGQSHIAYKYIFDQDRRLLGAHFTGEGADEVINLFGLALGHVGDNHPLYAATLTYPSVSAALQNAFRSALKGIMKGDSVRKT
jgi:glutathione reductase (NADPH)